ncbi:MAG: serine--tRNA ligase, partial [Alphaproteobacteria bacterium]|nr:serine--tRNA ligase [Alphaproteobacteria bacterium]
MYDIKFIRENPAEFDAGLERRGLAPLSAELIALDAERRKALTEAQQFQEKRNKLSKEIGMAKREGRDATEIMAQVSQSKTAQAEAEEKSKVINDQLTEQLSSLPNAPLDDVPDGASEDDNVEVRKWGEPKAFSFAPKEHFDIGENLGLMDFETAAKISGSRFVLLSGALARMERALSSFMLDHNTEEFGYT